MTDIETCFVIFLSLSELDFEDESAAELSACELEAAESALLDELPSPDEELLPHPVRPIIIAPAISRVRIFFIILLLSIMLANNVKTFALVIIPKYPPFVKHFSQKNSKKPVFDKTGSKVISDLYACLGDKNYQFVGNCARSAENTKLGSFFAFKICVLAILKLLSVCKQESLLGRCCVNAACECIGEIKSF